MTKSHCAAARSTTSTAPDRIGQGACGRAARSEAREKKRWSRRAFSATASEPPEAMPYGSPTGPVGPLRSSSARSGTRTRLQGPPPAAGAVSLGAGLGDLGIEQLRVCSTKRGSEVRLRLRCGESLVDARISETASSVEVTLEADSDPALLGRIAAALAARGHQVEADTGLAGESTARAGGAPLRDFGSSARWGHDGAGHSQDATDPQDEPSVGPSRAQLHQVAVIPSSPLTPRGHIWSRWA